MSHLAEGGAPRAVWGAAPGTDWPLLVAHAVAAAVHAGRGALVCVPDHRDVDRVSAALTAVLGADSHVTLTADDGPALRYRRFLAVSRGRARVVVGTRSASFAPVHDLGLVVLWDDGDDLHGEPRAPYPHTRETLLLRAEQQGTAALLGGFARTAEAQYLLRTGWAREIAPTRGLVRARLATRVAGATDRARERDPHAAGARLPAEVHQTVRDALEHGPVLVQTPRLGYVPSLACERCREPARCRTCSGPLALPSPTAPPTCRWCGTEQPAWACAVCGHRGLRAPVVGDSRTAEELGRTFPAVRVRSSSGDRVLAAVEDRPAIVVATPGRGARGRGGLRRRRAARHLADPGPDRPARHGGGAAALGQRRGPGPRRAARRWPSAIPPTPHCRPWSAGTRPASPSARSPSGRRRTCPRRPGWRPSPASPVRWTTR